CYLLLPVNMLLYKYFKQLVSRMSKAPNSQIRKKSACCFSNKQGARQCGRIYYYSSASITCRKCISLIYVMLCFCQCTRHPQESGMFTLHPQLAQDSIV